MIPSERQLQQMIQVALADQAPQIYRELQEAKELDSYTEAKAQEMLAEFGEQMSMVTVQVAKSSMPYLERVQALTSAQQLIWSQILANHLEFPEPETIESDEES